ncbi:PLC-like phosphodiesterase, partial [Thermothelomyces heterothallicus CBS 203.75]
DPTLKRCFGVDARIADCDWSYLSTLRTLQHPREGMPRLADLLEWLATAAASSELPAAASVWLLLDIKTDDDPERLLPAVARTIASAPPPPGGDMKGWKKRIVIGAWNEHYIRHARLHLPGHPLAYIGFSLLYARRFLSDEYSDVHFNLAQPTLVGPLGAAFRGAVRARGRRLFVWTVNEPRWMAWAVSKGVDGVVTDEVVRLRAVLDRPSPSLSPSPSPSSSSASSASDIEAEANGNAEGLEVGIGVGPGDGMRWPHTIRLYLVAMLWQVGAALLTILLWYSLNTRGRPKKGRGAGLLGGATLPVKA